MLEKLGFHIETSFRGEKLQKECKSVEINGVI
jgi:hypothetical protein